MSALLLDLEPGDEVIIPSFTFVSTANAFVLAGAVPVFVDIRPDTLNVDEEQVEAALTDRTRAIVPVHYGGVPCEMTSILNAAHTYDVTVIEDNAHGLFGAVDGRPLGTFGAMSTLSFHETKNISTGEGGALVINDPLLVERAEIIREKGTDRSRFFRGQVDKYTWVDIGSSYLPSELIAAVLVAQLRHADAIQRQRGVIWKRYATELEDWARSNDVLLPSTSPTHAGTFHLFHMRLVDLETRTRFIQHMRDQGIMCVFHYLPLHSSPMGERVGRAFNNCPVTQEMSDRLVRLPLFADMTAIEQDRVVAAVLSFEP